MASEGEQYPELIAQYVTDLTGHQYVFVPPSNRTDEVETMESHFQSPNHNVGISSDAQVHSEKKSR